jgi:hypothetical protein
MSLKNAACLVFAGTSLLTLLLLVRLVLDGSVFLNGVLPVVPAARVSRSCVRRPEFSNVFDKKQA